MTVLAIALSALAAGAILGYLCRGSSDADRSEGQSDVVLDEHAMDRREAELVGDPDFIALARGRHQT